MSVIYAVIRILGIAGLTLGILQSTSISRTPAFEKMVSMAKRSGLHRTVGMFVFLCIFIHGAFMLTFNLVTGEIAENTEWKLLGAFGFALLILLVGIGIAGSKWSSRYELFRILHKIGAAGLLLGLIHAVVLGSFVGGSLAVQIILYILFAFFVLSQIYLLVRRITVKKNPMRIAEVVAENDQVTTLRVEGRNIKHQPGQYAFIRCSFDEPFPGSRGIHPFTISSPPAESYISFTVKASGDYTERLGSLTPGSSVLFDGPYGDFVLPDEEKPLVLFAGGIGITPFLSMLREIAKREWKEEITLFWAVRRTEDLFCMTELDRYVAQFSRFHVIYIVTRDRKWRGERGHISENMIRHHVSQWERTDLFICGPGRFKRELSKLCSRLGKKGGKIHIEDFSL